MFYHLQPGRDEERADDADGDDTDDAGVGG
jgi:hypothetical protein